MVQLFTVKLAQVIHKYLVYIPPVCEMLRREQVCPLCGILQGEQRDCEIHAPSRLPFRCGAAHGKPWDSGRVASILRKTTAEVWG